MRSREASRIDDRPQELRAVLREAGLAGQVRIGVPLPLDGDPRSAGIPQTGRLSTQHPTPQAEEGSRTPLDSLLGLSLSGVAPRASRGRLIEIEGEISSGRTALAYRLVAAATVRGELAAWIDLPNALDPRFLRRAGAVLDSLLWVRPPRVESALRAAELLLRTGFAMVVLDLDGAPPGVLARLGPGVWTRLLRAVRRARAAAVLLAPAGSERLAGATATLGLRTERRQALFECGLFEGLEPFATVVRNRQGPTGIELPFRVFHRAGPATPAASPGTNASGSTTVRAHDVRAHEVRAHNVPAPDVEPVPRPAPAPRRPSTDRPPVDAPRVVHATPGHAGHG